MFLFNPLRSAKEQIGEESALIRFYSFKENNNMFDSGYLDAYFASVFVLLLLL